MLKKLADITDNSKYTTIYFRIVSNAQDRVAIYSTNRAKKLEATRLKGYVEAHHIIPRSIMPEYAKSSSNLVYLTPKEHYICHMLLTKMFKNEAYRAKMLFAFSRVSSKHGIKASMFHVLKLKYAEANRKKALKEMQNPETKAKFVEAGLSACKKKRDKDTKAWAYQSMCSAQGRQKLKEVCQTDEFREKCREREMSKTKEQRTTLAKQGQQALMEKCGGEEAYRKMLSDRIKGRKKYVNSEGVVRVLREPLEGFVLLTQKRIADDL